MGERCHICGETAPEPASLCLRRLAGIAEAGEPCDYSLEGEARFAAAVGDDRAVLIRAILEAPIAKARPDQLEDGRGQP